MLKIAILDDINNHSEYLQVIEDCFIHTTTKFKAEVFENATLLHPKIENKSFDIYIINMQLSKYDSLDIAKDINVNDPLAKIILITNTNNYDDDIYEIENTSLLLRSDIKQYLPFTLRKAMKMINKRISDVISVKYKGEVYLLKLEDIFFIERTTRILTFYTKDEQFCTYMTFDYLEENLSDKFIQCHRSFVVNIALIEKIVGNDIIMKDKRVVPIGRLYKKSFQDRLYNIQFK